MIEPQNIWQLNSAVLFLRYFLFSGFAYFILYVTGKNKYLLQKNQQDFPTSPMIRLEIYYSVLSLVIYSALGWVVFFLTKSGYTRIYFDYDNFGWSYFFISILMMIIIHDAYFYWTHRMLHHPYLFRIVHKVHHYSNNPTPWATFSFHPVEAIISTGHVFICILLFPVHPIALFIFLTIMNLSNLVGHLGYELFSLKFRKSGLGKFLNNSTYHNLHHKYSRDNYGLYFTIWDKLMRTER